MMRRQSCTLKTVIGNKVYIGEFLPAEEYSGEDKLYLPTDFPLPPFKKKGRLYIEYFIIEVPSISLVLELSSTNKSYIPYVKIRKYGEIKYIKNSDPNMREGIEVLIEKDDEKVKEVLKRDELMGFQLFKFPTRDAFICESYDIKGTIFGRLTV